ncbi:MAG TPA: YciI family protein [Fibrobacteria bacterium]|nr:YciI family protein [Fibrobacteria bacterium]
MRFMMLMYPDKSAEQGVMPNEALINAMMKYNEELLKAGVLLSLDGLHPSSKGARIRFSDKTPDKRAVVDGPFTESKELIGGYWILQVKSKAEAVEWAKRVPAPAGAGEGMIELRQIFEPSDFGAEVGEREARFIEGMADNAKR